MRNRIYILLLLVIQLFINKELHAQLDTIFDQGVNRTFILHLPAGYTPDNQYPLVLNLHGLNSNAIEQEFYSQFDAIADQQQMIVVYPNAINSNWSMFDNKDINFISHLVDTIRANYSCNQCLFSTGMSQGGFMSYIFACQLPKPITAIAVVTGNMLQNVVNTCVVDNPVPVMHFHGTADAVVNYNGSFGVLPVEETIQWWVNENECNTTPVITYLPDTNPDDASTAERYYYGDGINGSEVTLYKIINGGHTWPGAIPIPTLGNTNQDINASQLIGEFFHQFCNPVTAVTDSKTDHYISIFPNPATQEFTITCPDHHCDLSIYTLDGQEIFNLHNFDQKAIVHAMGFLPGLYITRIKTGEGEFFRKIILTR